MASTLMTPIGIACFVDGLFKPKPAAKGSDKLRHSFILLFDTNGVKSTAYEELRRGVHEAVAEKFGAAKANDPAFLRSIKSPFRPAAEKNYTGFEKGEIYISPWCNPDTPPGIVDLHGQKIVVPTDVWSGQLARATVRPFAYDSNGNKGAAFYLEHVQIVKQDMPRLDNKVDAAAAFAQADNSQLAALGIDINGAASSGVGGSDLPW